MGQHRLDRAVVLALEAGELVAMEVQVPFSCTRAPAQLGELARQAAGLGVNVAVAGTALELPGADKPIQDLELCRGEHELAVLVLAEEREEVGPERPQIT